MNEKTENQNLFATERFLAEVVEKSSDFQEKANQGLLKKRRILERMAQSYLSIIMVNPPRGVFQKLEELNRFFLKCNTMLYNKQITAQEILEIREKVKNLAESTWQLLGQVFPLAYVYPIKNWTQLNDDLRTKQALVKQYWTRALGINPVVDEVAMLAIVLKHLCQLRKRVIVHGDYALAETLIKVRDVMETGIREILDYANSKKNNN